MSPTIVRRRTCPLCKRRRLVRRRRLNTAFVDNRRNFLASCRECFEHAWAYWADQWSDYYADCM